MARTKQRCSGMIKNAKDRELKLDVDKVTFRLFAPYDSLVAQQAKAARIKPNQFARLATMCMADGQLLNLSERMERIEAQLIRLRRDFNDAVDRQRD